jgi:hypothetical protein
MTREELVAELNRIVKRLAELGQVVGIALGAQEHTEEDLAAILTASAEVKGLADALSAKLGPRHSRNYRKISPVVDSLRKWSMGARLLHEGLVDKSPNLLKMGASQFQTASQELVRRLILKPV